MIVKHEFFSFFFFVVPTHTIFNEQYKNVVTTKQNNQKQKREKVFRSEYVGNIYF